ncbi:MAG: hypothetical protein H8E71_04170 [Candidatus Marinimicrobia bacterium]|nr:hypothetical protein [Candidatus Neomarinimicrobiota bacterium]
MMITSILFSSESIVTLKIESKSYEEYSKEILETYLYYQSLSIARDYINSNIAIDSYHELQYHFLNAMDQLSRRNIEGCKESLTKFLSYQTYLDDYDYFLDSRYDSTNQIYDNILKLNETKAYFVSNLLMEYFEDKLSYVKLDFELSKLDDNHTIVDFTDIVRFLVIKNSGEDIDKYFAKLIKTNDGFKLSGLDLFDDGRNYYFLISQLEILLYYYEYRIKTADISNITSLDKDGPMKTIDNLSSVNNYLIYRYIVYQELDTNIFTKFKDLRNRFIEEYLNPTNEDLSVYSEELLTEWINIYEELLNGSISNELAMFIKSVKENKFDYHEVLKDVKRINASNDGIDITKLKLFLFGLADFNFFEQIPKEHGKTHLLPTTSDKSILRISDNIISEKDKRDGKYVGIWIYVSLFHPVPDNFKKIAYALQEKFKFKNDKKSYPLLESINIIRCYLSDE